MNFQPAKVMFGREVSKSQVLNSHVLFLPQTVTQPFTPASHGPTHPGTTMLSGTPVSKEIGEVGEQLRSIFSAVPRLQTCLIDQLLVLLPVRPYGEDDWRGILWRPPRPTE